MQLLAPLFNINVGIGQGFFGRSKILFYLNGHLGNQTIFIGRSVKKQNHEYRW
jgi:hypothetical protein